MSFILDKIAQLIKGPRNDTCGKPKQDNLGTGRLGEKLARRYLIRKGYRIIEQNWRTKYAEIDLVTRKKDTLVFVEVRTKTSGQFGLPEESLNRQKINRVIRSSQIYIKYKRYTGRYRIDSVCVTLDANHKLVKLNHYPNITL
jgi:putative endonuclease